MLELLDKARFGQRATSILDRLLGQIEVRGAEDAGQV